jgi:lipopolysaccharide assembly protein A
MSMPHPNRDEPPTVSADAAESQPSPATLPATPATRPATPADQRSTSGTSRIPRTRTGATWIGLCAAVLAVVALIVFMLQNTSNVEVTFLWMHGTLPLALALLIAAVGATMLAMIVGTARIAQLRRLFSTRAVKARRTDGGSPTS